MAGTHLMLFLVLSAIVAPAQTARELTARYGDPEWSDFLYARELPLWHDTLVTEPHVRW